MAGVSIIHVRAYDHEKDREAVRRIWKEIGWLEEGMEPTMDIFLDSGRAMVGDVNGEAECLVVTSPGSMRYLEQELPFCCVGSVGTSRIARKQGLALKVTATSVAMDAAQGALVAGLGVFEQGFYNQLGFGTGSYELWFYIDPSSLKADHDARIPRRLSADDWEKMHECHLKRRRGHGAVNMLSKKYFQTECRLGKNAFGFGYFDQKGELTHCVFLGVEKASSGPYWVRWLAYRKREQFLELLSLIKNLGDQVRLVRIREPPGMHFQDFIKEPFKRRQMTQKSEFEQRANAAAYWQMRILDLEGCMEKTRLSGDLRFNLELTDPIKEFLPGNVTWRGISGEYVVGLGKQSRAEKGKDERLPTLRASVGAFTRMWLGAYSATGLAISDDLHGPEELLKNLDGMFTLPQPHPDWEI